MNPIINGFTVTLNTPNNITVTIILQYAAPSILIFDWVLCAVPRNVFQTQRSIIL